MRVFIYFTDTRHTRCPYSLHKHNLPSTHYCWNIFKCDKLVSVYVLRHCSEQNSVHTIDTFLFYLYLFYVYESFPEYMSVQILWLVSAEARKVCQIPWYWSHRQLWANMWVWVIEPWSRDAGTVSALDLWATSSATQYMSWD